MGMTKVAINLDEDLLKRVDQLVQEMRFPDRNQVIQIALREKIAKLDRSRLLEEAAKLDPEEEQALAEEGMAGDAAEWPRY